MTRSSRPNDYVELHCHSCFSLLDGAALPEVLAARAANLGLPALARLRAELGPNVVVRPVARDAHVL